VSLWLDLLSTNSAIAAVLLNSWPKEPFDPDFAGQDLETYYFDTPSFALPKARRGREHYLTLRVRCYGDDAYALSAKTEDAKFRVAISSTSADAILNGHFETIAKLLPADLLARLRELADSTPVKPVVCVQCRRYAVENAQDRLTLDCDIHTDTGKLMPHAVIEFKSTEPDEPPESLAALRRCGRSSSANSCGRREFDANDCVQTRGSPRPATNGGLSDQQPTQPLPSTTDLHFQPALSVYRPPSCLPAHSGRAESARQAHVAFLIRRAASPPNGNHQATLASGEL
jgi:hypothetical protein